MPDREFFYDRPLTIEKIVDAPTEDGLNEVDLDDPTQWETYWPTDPSQPVGFCRQITSGSREFIRAARQDATISSVLVVRWSPETDAIEPQTMRINFGNGRTLQIAGVENIDNQNREVRLTCTEFITA